MQNTVVLFDLENQFIQASELRDYIENDQAVYLFSLKGRLDYALEDLTELAGWISSGALVILDAPKASEAELAYAFIAGQLMAVLAEDAAIILVSANKKVQLLVELLENSARSVRLERFKSKSNAKKSKFSLPPLSSFQADSELKEIKKYCHALADKQLRPNSLSALQKSIQDSLHVSAERSLQLISRLIDLKIIKLNADQIRWRKKLLRQWIELELEQNTALVDQTATVTATKLPVPKQAQHQLPATLGPQVVVGDVDSIMQFLQQQQPPSEGPFPATLSEVQWSALQKIAQLQHARPKDIFSLRDLLSDWFPQTDIHSLIKFFIDKGYLELQDDQLHYSAQMSIQ